MEILNLIFFGLIYIIITFINGRFLLLILKIDYKKEILNLFLGFLLLETLSFLFFIIFGLFGYKNFIVSFFPNIILSLISIFYFLSGTSNFLLPKFHWSSILWKPSIFLFISIYSLYFINLSELFLNVLNSSGIIYQDIIYHGGIIQSMINFGYPVNDLQFKGKLLNYHILTHFIAAKFSYITFTNVFISYHIFLNFLGILLYSFLSIFFIERFFSSNSIRGKYHQVIIGVIGLISFFCTFWLGGVLNYSYISAFYLSASFKWQLIIILVFFLMLFPNIVNKEGLKHRSILIILLFTATLFKVSSLPLILAGLGAVFLFNLIFFNKQNLIIWGQLLFSSLVVGVFIFISFFEIGTSQSSTIDFNIDLLRITPIIAYFKIESIILTLIIYLITVLSFRFVLIYRLKTPEAWFAGAVLFAGFVLSLLVKDNQLYFILPAIILSSHLAIIYLLNIKLKKIILLPVLFFLILSFYQIGGLGVTLKDKFESKKNYYPLNAERIELYTWLEQNSDKNQVFFTTSLYASPDMMADNYAPAAFSERQSFLGGFRFGGIEYENEFEKRFETTKNFNFHDEQFWKILKKENIEFVLIEKEGNFNENLFINSKVNFNENLFRIVFSNKEGIIFQIIDRNAFLE